jgi:DNA-binding NarL/FixJ family response regulator
MEGQPVAGTDATHIRVLIVDDAEESREALRRALAFDTAISVVGEAGSGVEAVERAESLHPDIVIMDVRMPGGDGVTATRTIALRLPATRIVALTAHEDPDTVRDMLVAGATGYVVKGTAVDELIATVRAAHTGEGLLDERVLPVALDDLRRLLREERHRRTELERLARMREEFVHVLAHELRTPLTVMVGALRTVEEVTGREDLAALVRSALVRGMELEHLIEGLELMGQSAEPGAESFPALAIADVLARLDHHPHSVEAPDEPWSGVPPRHLTRVTQELIDNAFRHGGPPVEIRAYHRGNEAFLEVRDGGDLEPDPGLLRPFVQEDMSTTRERGGLGLGLFVASRLCEALGGALELRRESGQTVAEARFPLTD